MSLLDARLYKKIKGDAARVCLMGHVLSDDRNGLVVNAKVTLATGKLNCKRWWRWSLRSTVRSG